MNDCIIGDLKSKFAALNASKTASTFAKTLPFQ
jgi:hypothetical protein